MYSIKTKDDAPTTESDLSIFFGQLDVTMKVAPGKGIVTSIVLESKDLDEIDWEWLGADNTMVQTNYFSKGCNATYDRGGLHKISNPQGEFHTYTLKWTREKLDWIINGEVIRTLNAAGLQGCAGYPQSPMRVKLGSWVAGKEGMPPGTIEWAGGLANFADGPFNAYYKQVRVQDFMGGGGAKEATEYVWTDRSGTWQSIKVVNDGNTVDDTTSSSSKSSTKSATTLSTASSTSGSAAPTGTGSGNSQPTGGGSSSSSSTTTTPPGSAPTGAAGKVAMAAGNMVAVAAAVLCLAL